MRIMTFMSNRKRLAVLDVVSLLTGDESDIDSESSDPEDVDCNGSDNQVDESFNVNDNDMVECAASSSASKPSYKWMKKKHNVPYPSCMIDSDSSSDIGESLESPYHYFKKFVTDEMIDLTVTESNIYYFQQKGQFLNLKDDELRSVLGMYLLMGIIQMPSVRDYFAHATDYEPISSVMSRNRFELILRHLHFANNDTVETRIKKNDKAWKITPWLELLRSQCILIEPQENNSIDEMMIPFKGKFSKIRQYIRGKPHPWGFKIWARTGEDGILYDFELYKGATPGQAKSTLGVGADVVLRLSATLPHQKNFKIFADNFFSGIPLMVELKAKGIQYTGTVRKGRLPGCALLTDKELEKAGRGAFDFRVERDSDICAVKWNDTKCVNLVSTYLGVLPISEARRWDKKEGRFVEIPRPNIVAEYNSKMGGVDFLDFLCGKYRYKLRSKRWYLHIFWFTVEVSVVNAWLLFRRDFKRSGLDLKKMIPLKEFQSQIANSLIKCGKTSKKRGRPSSSDISFPSTSRQKKKVDPPTDVRNDGYQHFPIFSSRGKCALCKVGFTETCCCKCGVRLCIKKHNNCFFDFHCMSK